MAFGITKETQSIPDSEFRAEHFINSEGDELSYRLFIPDGYNEKKSYPVVLFFHGAGERGSDNTAQLKWGVKQFALDSIQAEHPCIILAPQCPVHSWWTGNRGAGNPDSGPGVGPGKRIQLAIGLLKQTVQDFSADTTRLYVTGISMGGFATWAAITHYPDLFAAAVPVCGGGEVTKAKLIRDVPLWNFHGALDTVVPPRYSRDMIRALHQAGGHPGYTEYPDVGHDSWVPAYREPYLFEWLFKQQKHVAPAL